MVDAAGAVSTTANLILEFEAETHPEMDPVISVAPESGIETLVTAWTEFVLPRDKVTPLGAAALLAAATLTVNVLVTVSELV
jgi:hypothetical protein